MINSNTTQVYFRLSTPNQNGTIQQERYLQCAFTFRIFCGIYMSDFYNHLLHLSGKTIDHCLWLDNTGVSNWGKGKSLKNVRILDTKKIT